MAKNLDQMNENMNATVNRGQALEDGIAKSENLVETSTKYKKTAVDVNRTMCWRKYMVWIIGSLIVIALIGLIVLIIKL